jgi:hypothetical protein
VRINKVKNLFQLEKKSRENKVEKEERRKKK